MADLLGVASFFDTGCLPTKVSVYNHYLKTRENGVKGGRWKSNIATSEVIKIVKEDVKCQWERTQIPTLFPTNPKKAERLITSTIEEAKTLLKIPSDCRDENFASEMNILLDLAACHHQNGESFGCPSTSRVPAAWKPFLLDQRGSRIMRKKLTNLTKFSYLLRRSKLLRVREKMNREKLWRPNM